MFYFLYDLFLFFAVLVYLPVYAFRGRVHKNILTRIGIFDRDFFRAVKGRDTVWLHAVSVGEVRAAESLLRLIRARWPDKSIVVSTVTPTGQAIVKNILKENEVAFYAPLDISWVVQRFFSNITASLVIIMETELWPNLIRLSKKNGASVVIVNGRISDRSLDGYERVRPVVKNILNDVALFCMQNEESRNRIIALGAPAERVRMTGNIKFDISADLNTSPVVRRARELLAGSLVFLCGSTHEGEEEIIVDLYKELRRDFSSLRLVIAPRHLTRIDRVRRLIKLAGFDVAYLSRLGQASAVSLTSSDILLVDTIGDLSALYGISDIAFIGGSLVRHGGHNPIEPAVFGKPVLFGNHMDNFREIRNIFLKEGAAVQVDSAQSLDYALRKLLASPHERKQLGERAKGLLDKNRGAAERTFAEIEGLFKR
jgi:3-deoxy-D-manno-octulosonic-acid transferase